ncbi:hypothetical protein CYFUS_008549 [Cystobacter fuscus]|uniref:Uncharacterized protein n=1 Tax=Cystobacter fuscus TaxID=43 RepID=A0A250JHH8_9BACT|nr:hypothetical protein [Cystobacter fuscus]ATB43070.1 hypothetical protein CYFUS_008549 [Cystobacter fuscus]
MLDPRDRRDLACLGLVVLVYGLALAPVLHAAVGHGHSHSRRHAPAALEARGHEREPVLGAAGHQHPVGSVEHLLALAVARVEVRAPAVWWTPVRWEPSRGPLWLPGEPLRPTAMPQGP